MPSFSLQEPTIVSSPGRELESAIFIDALEGRWDAVFQHLQAGAVDSGAQTPSDGREPAVHRDDRGAVFHVNAQTATGVTLLHHAADQANLPVIERLLAMGANIHATDIDEEQPIHWASASLADARFHVVRDLVHAGADINALSRSGETPLINSILRADLPMMSHLLDLGASYSDVETKASSDDRDSPLAVRTLDSRLSEDMRTILRAATARKIAHIALDEIVNSSPSSVATRL